MNFPSPLDMILIVPHLAIMGYMLWRYRAIGLLLVVLYITMPHYIHYIFPQSRYSILPFLPWMTTIAILTWTFPVGCFRNNKGELQCPL